MKRNHQGLFRPKNPKKYKGDPGQIVYRSSWEKIFMNYCDLREDIQKWNSEEVVIPYYDPIQKKWRRYFPDFLVQYKNKEGIIMTEIVEVKPYKEVIGPPVNPTRKTKSWVYEVKTYVTNQSKWKAASEFCENRGRNFRLVTEKELGIKG